ncbi:hypothetical protein [Dysgonomonas sp. 25]|uniref:hypothetical protein n=1 Tax=Dysgonomonas sp. 25 TaxID=2302933 RepID=UPI0013CF57C9|nr:hypothetical protein [Dysgonomonas sp. 25]
MSRLLREEKRDFSVNSEQHYSVNSYQSTVNNKIHVGAKHRSAKRSRANKYSPVISDIYGAMFIAPYKANSLMLPRLLRRGYDCIFQEMTLVKRYLAKAIFEPTFRDLHLKVEAIKKNIHVCVRLQIDISGKHTGLPLRSNETRCFAFAQHDNKTNSYQLMAYKTNVLMCQCVDELIEKHIFTIVLSGIITLAYYHIIILSHYHIN